MAKLSPISGFPEWLPEQKLIEDQIISQIKTIYQQHGFIGIETPAVELVDTLTSQGVVDKELYVVKRLHAEGNEEAALGLHFDVTVPFARYTAQHLAKLTFPFKRYQLQKVWRGERPQKGRYREFYQFDVDMVARDDLPIACDAEIVTVFDKALESLANIIGPHTLKINSRKILSGYYQSLGLDSENSSKAVQIVDKILKIGPDGVLKELRENLQLAEGASKKILEFATLTLPLSEIESMQQSYSGISPLLDEGFADLVLVRSLLSKESVSRIVVDGSLARGLAYYTGIIFETALERFPQYGSICSGGRYDNLASQFTSQKLPGVGGSIGLSRLMGMIFEENLVPLSKKTLLDALITVYNEEQRPSCITLAETLRKSGLNIDVYFKSSKLGKQIDYADALGVQWIIFIKGDGTGYEIKSLKTKEQKSVATEQELLSIIAAQ